MKARSIWLIWDTKSSLLPVTTFIYTTFIKHLCHFSNIYVTVIKHLCHFFKYLCHFYQAFMPLFQTFMSLLSISFSSAFMSYDIKYPGFTLLWLFPQVTLGMTGSLNKQRGKTFKEAQQENRGVSNC